MGVGGYRFFILLRHISRGFFNVLSCSPKESGGETPPCIYAAAPKDQQQYHPVGLFILLPKPRSPRQGHGFTTAHLRSRADLKTRRPGPPDRIAGSRYLAGIFSGNYARPSGGGICATCSTACESAPNWIAKSGPFEKRRDTLFFAPIKKGRGMHPGLFYDKKLFSCRSYKNKVPHSLKMLSHPRVSGNRNHRSCAHQLYRGSAPDDPK